jgi:hypothetical protein
VVPLTYKERNDGGADIDESSGLGRLVGGEPEGGLDGGQGQGRPGHHSAQAQCTQTGCTVHTMDNGTIKTQNPKCRLYWCLIELIDWRMQSVMLVFSTQFCELLLILPSLWFTFLPPPPFPKSVCVGDHILQEFDTLVSDQTQNN